MFWRRRVSVSGRVPFWEWLDNELNGRDMLKWSSPGYVKATQITGDHCDSASVAE